MGRDSKRRSRQRVRSKKRHHSSDSSDNEMLARKSHNTPFCTSTPSGSHVCSHETAARSTVTTPPVPTMVPTLPSTSFQTQTNTNTHSGTPLYAGRMELIPVFNASTDSMLIETWLDKINSIGELYSWDDRAKIFAMIGRLAGNAKLWFDCQTDMNLTWEQWQFKLKDAFPSFKGVAAKLKEFVNIERKPHEDIISFYYAKLKLGIHCNQPDSIITDVMISTLNNQLLQSSAHAAGCKSTKQLLQFLIDADFKSSPNQERVYNKQRQFDRRGSKHDNTKNCCFSCGKPGHRASTCHKN